MSWGSYYFKIFKEGNIKYNVNYDEVFLSYVKIKDEDYYIEHNDTFTDKEIIELEEICTTHNKESQRCRLQRLYQSFAAYPNAFVTCPRAFAIYPNAFVTCPRTFAIYPNAFATCSNASAVYPCPFVIYPSAFATPVWRSVFATSFYSSTTGLPAGGRHFYLLAVQGK